MKILNFGSCNIDYVYSVPHFVSPGETLSADELNSFPGGKGLNQSIAVANAGCRIFHAGCIGKDGSFLKELLESKNVNTDYLYVVDEKTGHAIIEVDKNGENRIILFSGANAKIDEQMIDLTLNQFSENDILILQNEISCRNYLIEKAKEKNMTIIFNPAPFTGDITLDLISDVSYLIVNETEAYNLTGQNEIDMIIEKIRSDLPKCKVVVTLGKEGCYYFDDKQIIRQNAFNVETVDTTAAGDTFIGYFVAGVAKNIPIETNLRICCMASAICVKTLGASTAIPTISEVEENICSMHELIVDNFLKKLKQYCNDNITDANIHDFSEKLNYSVQYVAKKIRQVTGKTFVSYLQDCRCEFALKLIIETNLPIGEIINRCGYSNESYFRKIFLQKYGCNPLKYRKKRNEKYV